MNTNSQNTTNTFLSENKKGLIILFILFLLSSIGMFGQTNQVAAEPTIVVVEVVNSNPLKMIASDSNVDFMNWFMGTKQTQFLKDNSQGSNSAISRKKQIISSGITPNKVLYRTLVKKIISQESAIV
jgi:hypothetical protein